MPTIKSDSNNPIPNGVMLNAYPDSIGSKLSDTIALLQRPEFKDVFSLFYILPTFFNSDLDRGFSIVDYNLNEALVSKDDLTALEQLDIALKFDIVLNHLSVGSPQFKDLLKNGDQSKYQDFFINWNEFWKGHEEKIVDGVLIPKKEYLDQLFMRKAGLPILKVPFPDGSEQPYWNTFYQSVTYQPLTEEHLAEIKGMDGAQKQQIISIVNEAIAASMDLQAFDFEKNDEWKAPVLAIVNRHKTFLGQMDVNAKSDLVWDFYDETLRKVSDYGCKILRLDAFAYLHKEIGQSNFFNKPGTWEYLSRINAIAKKYNLTLLPEIHAEYGQHLHQEVAAQGYQIYDFFFPGLVIHTIENANNTALLKWIQEIIDCNYQTVNMLGCHDGIPVLDLKGKSVEGTYFEGLLKDTEIESIMDKIMQRGGRVKNLYDPQGNKISYYQINATFFSALGEDEQKLLLARAIQLFMPGIPQVWYLDIFAGTNDYAAADAAGTGGHKEINRTTLTLEDIEKGLQKEVVQKQLELLRFRNTFPAFAGDICLHDCSSHQLDIEWRKGKIFARLQVDLRECTFELDYAESFKTNF